VGARNFNYSPFNFPLMGVKATNFAFLEENFTRRKIFSDNVPTAQNLGDAAPPPSHDATVAQGSAKYCLRAAPVAYASSNEVVPFSE